MWFILPQLRGLGRSSTAPFYALNDKAEARAFLEHPFPSTLRAPCLGVNQFPFPRIPCLGGSHRGTRKEWGVLSR